MTNNNQPDRNQWPSKDDFLKMTKDDRNKILDAQAKSVQSHYDTSENWCHVDQPPRLGKWMEECLKIERMKITIFFHTYEKIWLAIAIKGASSFRHATGSGSTPQEAFQNLEKALEKEAREG